MGNSDQYKDKTDREIMTRSLEQIRKLLDEERLSKLEKLAAIFAEASVTHDMILERRRLR